MDITTKDLLNRVYGKTRVYGFEHYSDIDAIANRNVFAEDITSILSDWYEDYNTKSDNLNIKKSNYAYETIVDNILDCLPNILIAKYCLVEGVINNEEDTKEVK